jgi:hypothetical protein
MYIYVIQQKRPFGIRRHVTAVVMGKEIREGNIIEALPQRCNIDKALRRSLRHVCHCLFPFA